MSMRDFLLVPIVSFIATFAEPAFQLKGEISYNIYSFIRKLSLSLPYYRKAAIYQRPVLCTPVLIVC
mgnify:CR=1 FL=1